MKKLALLSLLFVMLVPSSGLGQGGTKTYVKYQDTGYKYLVAKKTDKVVSDFFKTSYNDATWTLDTAAVGTLNNTTSPPCPLNTSEYIHILWPSSREVLLRKEIELDPGARNVQVSLTLDNGALVYWNGVDISNGIQVRNGCASPDNLVLPPVPPNALSGSYINKLGKRVHLLAIRGNWQSSKNYLDAKVTGELPFTVTASAEAGGTITPSGSISAFQGDSLVFVAKANAGYHVASITVDDTLRFQSAPQPTSVPDTLRFVLRTVTGNHVVTASFAENYYSLDAKASDANGEVRIESESTPPYNGATNPPFYRHGTTLKVRAYAPAGSYVSGWTINGVTITGGGNPLAVTMDKDKSITANYTALPATPTIYTVDNPLDTAPGKALLEGTLRWAVSQADSATPGLDIVQFDFSGDETIYLKSPLPAYDQLVYDATSSGGKVVIQPAGDFTSSTTAPDGLLLSGLFFQWGYTPEGSTVKGLEIRNFPGAGICIGSDSNFVEGCVITGNEGDGICIIGGSRNTIGGTGTGKGNTIYNNRGNGVSVKRSAVTGNPPTIPPPPSRNAFLGNSIYSNNLLGIDLIGINLTNYSDVKGVTWNRFPDGTTRSWSDFVNNGQNFPDLYFASAVPDDPAVPQISSVLGKLYGPPGISYRIEVFANTGSDASGNGEGETLIGTSDDTEDSIVEDAGNPGFYQFEIPLRVPLRGGEILSASATDEDGNTSEFSTVIYAGVVTRRYGPMEALTQPEYQQDTRWVVNTTFSGIPLHWPDGKGEFVSGTSFDAAEALPFREKIPVAFQRWNTQNAGNDVPLKYAAESGGTPTNVWGGEPDGRNTLVFAKDPGSWTSTTGLTATNILAITRVRYKVSKGEITDADVIFNAEHFAFRNYTAPPDPATTPDNNADFEAVLTHEIGHWGGLADFYNPGDPFYNLFMGQDPSLQNLTMYGIVQKTDLFHRTIYADDVAGIKFIYGEAPSGRADIVLLFDGSNYFVDPTGVNGFEPAKNAVHELIDKMRNGDRIAVAKLDGTTQLTMTELTPTNRETVADDVTTNLLPDGVDSRPIGSGLQDAALLFPTQNAGAKGIILFSAGNETEAPSALDPSVLSALAGIPVYTMGFSQSVVGQNLSGSLAEATGGAYYFAADSTISEIVNQIWFNQVGLQLSGSSVFPSDAAISWQGSAGEKAISWQGSTSWQAISWQGTAGAKAISYQGKVDNGATSLQPAISWQGTKTGTAAKLAEAGDLPKFHLALWPPDFDPTGIDWENLTQDPPGTITPANWQQYEGVQYVYGPTHAFYVISENYPGKKDGTWTLLPVGANGVDPNEPGYLPEPQYPVPVLTSLASNTDVIMDVTLDKSTYSLQDVVIIRVTLTEGGQVQALHTLGGGPISGATVTASIRIPGTVAPETVTLTESGNGIYSGKFVHTTVGGTYDVTVLSSGIAPVLNSPFERRWEESFYIVPAYFKAVLFAENSVQLGDKSTVTTGDVLVNRDAPAGASGYELTVRVGASTPAGYNLKADRIRIDSGATVMSDLYYNELSNGAGTPSGAVNTPLSLPVGEFPPFESTPSEVLTATPFSVGTGKDGGTLTPGTYAALTLEPGAKLTLTAGTYNFRSIRLKTKSSLAFTGDARIRVRYGIHADNESSVGPATPTSPTGTIFFVQSSNSESITSNAVDFSPKSTIKATIFAPSGTILLNQESRATGAFLAKDIVIGQSVSLSLASAFGTLQRSSGTDGEGAAEGTRSTDEIPETYVLSQNYPNPFNPSTQIRYGLPAPSYVTLTVYNSLGQEVVRLLDGVQPAGYHDVRWDGRSGNGTPVSTGVYFYQLRASDPSSGPGRGFMQVMKMLLLK